MDHLQALYAAAWSIVDVAAISCFAVFTLKLMIVAFEVLCEESDEAEKDSTDRPGNNVALASDSTTMTSRHNDSPDGLKQSIGKLVRPIVRSRINRYEKYIASEEVENEVISQSNRIGHIMPSIVSLTH